MKKKVVLLVLGMLCLLALPAWGAGEDIRLVINGALVQPEQPPLLLEERVYVPMRYVGEYLDAQVEYIAATEADSAHIRLVKKLGEGMLEQVTMYYGEHELDVRYTIDDKVYALTQTAPQTMTLINGVSYVPLRTAGETLHCSVQWQGDTRTVTITEQTVEKAALLQTIKALQKETTTDDLTKDTDARKTKKTAVSWRKTKNSWKQIRLNWNTGSRNSNGCRKSWRNERREITAGLCLRQQIGLVCAYRDKSLTAGTFGAALGW